MSWEEKIMKSKTSYFNKAVFKKDITQFWSFWAMEIFLAFLGFIMPLTRRISMIKEEQAQNVLQIPYDVGLGIVNLSRILSSPFIIGTLAIFLAVVIFHYTFNSRDMYMTHSFPIKREGLFISHYAAGIVILLIPYVIGFTGYIIAANVYKTGMTSDILLLAFEVFAMIVLFFSIACAAVMVSGNSIMSIVIYGCVNILYIAMYMMFCSLNQMFSYASREISITDVFANRFTWLSPIVYILKKVGFKAVTSASGEYKPGVSAKYAVTGSDTLPFVGMFVAGVIIFGVSLMLYKYRKSETVGDMVSFKWCRPVFKTVFSIAGGVFFALLLWSIYFYDTNFISGYIGYEGKNLKYAVILVLICVSICYFVSEMILGKTFFIWKSFSKSNFSAVFGFMFIFLVLQATGVIGVKIPDISKVSSLEISSENELLYTDKDDISKFIKINKEIEQKKLSITGDDYTYTCSIEFIYRLNNGSERKFEYTLPTRKDSFAADIVKCANGSKQKFDSLFSRAYNESDYKLQNMDVEIEEDSSDDSYTEWHTYSAVDEKSREKLYQAMKKDITDGNIDIFSIDEGSTSGASNTRIAFKPYVNQVMADKYKMSDYEKQYFYVNRSDAYAPKKSLTITSKAKNTMSVISELKKAGKLTESSSDE